LEEKMAYIPNDTAIIQLWSFLLVILPYFLGAYIGIFILWLIAMSGKREGG